MASMMVGVSSRDVVVASSLLLSGCALLPLAEVLARVNTPNSSSSQPFSLTDRLRVLTELTSLDQCALLACVTFIGLALTLVFVNATAALGGGAKKAVNVLRMSAAALALVTLATALLLAVVLVAQEEQSVWHARVFTQREELFEARVNDVYCHVKGAQVCQFGSLAEAKEVFPLHSWPVGASTQPGKTIRSSCDGFDDSVRQWGYPVKMELCRLCNAISMEEQRGGEELLEAVQDISLQELQWCGAYLVDDERANLPQPVAAAAEPASLRGKTNDFDDEDNDEDNEQLLMLSVRDSPYRKNRLEFQKLLAASAPRFTLTLGVKALGALVAFAVPCLLALFYSLLLVTRTRSGCTVAVQDSKAQA